MTAPFRLASGRNPHSAHRPTATSAPIMLLLAVVALLAVMPAKADVTLSSIGQSPQNTVSPGQAITYSLPVSSNASARTVDYVYYNILLNGTDISSQFTPVAPCGLDGSTVYCNGNGITVSSPQTYQVTWNNPAPKSGSYQLTFQVRCDTGSGTPCSGTSATVTTVVSAPPAANSDSATTSTGQPVTIDVLANDSGPTGVAFSISSVTQPAHGKATDNDGASITYTPAAGFSGTDRFSYTIRNTNGQTASATVTVTVEASPTAAAPVAVPDTGATSEGSPVTLNVLSNDEPPSGQTIYITSVSRPTHGTTVVNENGTITYTPDRGFSGTDSFQYTITDSADQKTSTTTVTVDIKSASRITAQAITRFHFLPGLTPNEYAVAVALDKYCADSGNAQIQSLCGQLNTQSASGQITALQQITPNEVASEGANGFLTTYTQVANIRMRLLALRQGAAGLSAANLSLGIQGQTVPAGRLLASLLKRASGGGASADDSGDERLGVFLNGRANFGSRDTTINETGFGFDTLGITMGMDYRFSARLVAGGALGFASTSNDFNAAGGKMKAHAYSVSTYGSYYLPKDFFLDWIGTYVHNTYDLKHNIVFSGLNSFTKASTGGDQYALAINAGRDFHQGGLLFTPYARVEYIATGIDAYQENSASGLAMAFNHQSLHYLTSVLAGRVSKSMSMTWGVLSPSLHLEWVHQYENGSRLIGGHFVGDPGASFNIQSDAPDRNYFNAGLGLVVTLPRGLSGFFNYETMLARNHVSNTLIQFGARMQF